MVSRELRSASKDPGAYGTGFVDGSGPGLPNVLILGLCWSAIPLYWRSRHGKFNAVQPVYLTGRASRTEGEEDRSGHLARLVFRTLAG